MNKWMIWGVTFPPIFWVDTHMNQAVSRDDTNMNKLLPSFDGTKFRWNMRRVRNMGSMSSMGPMPGQVFGNVMQVGQG